MAEHVHISLGSYDHKSHFTLSIKTDHRKTSFAMSPDSAVSVYTGNRTKRCGCVYLVLEILSVESEDGYGSYNVIKLHI